MTESRLDSLLQDWTTRHSLPSTRTEAIRDTILATPQITVTALPYQWWEDFSITLKGTIRQAAKHPPIWSIAVPSTQAV